MKNNPCLKSVLRQPVRTVFLLLLCAAVGFAFFSQVLQYSVLDRATAEIGSYYRSIGSLTSADPNGQYDISGCMPALRKSDDVEFIDERRMITFTMEDVYSADIYSHTPAIQDVYLCGNVVSTDLWSAEELTAEGAFKALVYTFEQDSFVDTAEELEYLYRLDLTLDVYETVAGLPEYAPKGRTPVHVYGDSAAELSKLADALSRAQAVFVRAQYNFVPPSTYEYIVKPLTDDTLYVPLEAGETPDLSDPALLVAAENIELETVNMHTSLLMTTKDMTAIPHFEQSYVLSDGRMLTYEDERNQNSVCVIRQELAKIRGLELGDTLRITLRDLVSMDNIRPGVEQVPWQEADSETVELTIVGLLTAANEALQYSMYYSRIYVPDWVVPESYRGAARDMVVADYTSFVLKDIRDQAAFEGEMAGIFEQQGFSLQFQPTGYDAFSAAAQPLRESTRTNMLLFGAVLLLTLVLVTALYLFFRRKELPILRALGVKRSRVIRAAFIPLALLSALGFGVGGICAYRYGMEKAAAALSGLQLDDMLTPQFSPWQMLLTVLGVWGILLVMAAAVLYQSTGRSVLEQMQSGVRQRAEKTAGAANASQAVQNTQGADAAPTFPQADVSPVPEKQTGHSGWSARWIGRRLVRMPAKTLLAALVAAGLLVGLSCIRSSIVTGQADIDQLYDTVEVTGQILRKDSLSSVPASAFLPAEAADELQELGSFTDAVREAGCMVDCLRMLDEEYAKRGGTDQVDYQTVCAVERPETFRPLTDGSLQITYRGGMNEELFFSNTTGKAEVIASETLLNTLSLQVGEQVYLSWGYYGLLCEIAGSFPGSLEEHGFDLLMSYDALAQFYADSLAPTGQQLYLRRFEFTVDRSLNREMSAFRTAAETTLENCGAPSPLLLVLWDSELTQAVEPLERNLVLLEILYPAMFALAILIAAGLAALMVLQTAKEAAVLRVLGVRKGHTAALLVIEQLAPAALGLLAGALILQIVPVGSVAWRHVWLCVAGYIVGTGMGAAISAAARIGKNPLELLQVKE